MIDSGCHFCNILPFHILIEQKKQGVIDSMTEPNFQRPDGLSRVLDKTMQGPLPLFLLLVAEIDALKKRYPVVVDEIVPSADPGSRSFLVKVSLSDGAGLYPGMFGRLMIPIGQIDKVFIPLEAVTRVGQLDFVVVKTQQGAVRRYVRLGERSPEAGVEIISGLAAGDQILISK